jgi:hypothetical protein
MTTTEAAAEKKRRGAPQGFRLDDGAGAEINGLEQNPSELNR